MKKKDKEKGKRENIIIMGFFVEVLSFWFSGYFIGRYFILSLGLLIFAMITAHWVGSKIEENALKNGIKRK